MITRDIGTTIKGLAEVTIVAVTVSAGAAGGAVDTVDSRITAATVYSDRASVERSVELDLAAGDHTLVFAGLPMTVDAASFRVSAEGLAGVTILGFNHTTHEHFETPREEAADLERRIRLLMRDSLTMLQDRLYVQTTQKNLLEAMNREKATDAAHTAGVGEIDVARWAEAYEFLGRRLADLSDSIRQTTFLIEDVNGRIETVGRRLAAIHSQQGTVTRVVEVEIRLEKPGTAVYMLDYLIPGAEWRPLYDARLAENGSTVEVAMFAEVRQNTGENWDDVELTLSTVQPSYGTGPGEVTPWYLATSTVRRRPIAGGFGRISGRLTDARTGDPVVGASVLVVGTQRGAQTDFDGRYMIPNMKQGTYTLRITAIGYSAAELANVNVAEGYATDHGVALHLATSDVARTVAVVGQQDRVRLGETASGVAVQPVTTVDELLTQVAGVVSSQPRETFVRGGQAGEARYIVEGVSLVDPLGGPDETEEELMADYAPSVLRSGSIARSFAAPGKQSVSSDRKAVRCLVGTWEVAANLSLICRPRLQEGVYRRADLANTTGTPLLPGRINVFADRSYLGQGEFDQIIVDGEHFSLPFGAASVVTMIRAVLEPKSERDGLMIVEREKVRVTLTNHGSTAQTVTVEEALPQSRDKMVTVKVRDIVPERTVTDEFGVARWVVTLAAGESRSIEYTYQIRYPWGLRIQGL